MMPRQKTPPPDHAHPIIRAFVARQTELGITDRELADRSGYCHTTIPRFRQGGPVPFLTAVDLCEAVGLILTADDGHAG